MLRIMVYLVTYDLNVPGKNYENLWSALKQYDYIRDIGLDSVWFLSTTSSAEQVSNHLKAHIDASDRLIVTQLQQGTHQGWLHKDVWAWIDERL
jgi:hypothetical protein